MMSRMSNRTCRSWIPAHIYALGRLAKGVAAATVIFLVSMFVHVLATPYLEQATGEPNGGMASVAWLLATIYVMVVVGRRYLD